MLFPTITRLYVISYMIARSISTIVPSRLRPGNDFSVCLCESLKISFGCEYS